MTEAEGVAEKGDPRVRLAAERTYLAWVRTGLALMGFGFWAVDEKASGRFVGELGFADFHRNIQPDMGRDPEIGWALATWAHGRGYATEAVGAALAWGDAQFGGGRTWCLIAPDNRASIGVAEKCGFRRFASGVYRDEPSLIFVR